MEKKNFSKKSSDTSPLEKSIKKKKNRKEWKKLKQLKKKRLIVRNLSFKVSEEELKNLFSKFGEVLDVKIPLNERGLKRGFGFIQFKDTGAQIKAIKELNFKKIHGRPIAVDFAVDKTTYQLQKSSKVESAVDEKEIKEEPDDSEDESIKSEPKSHNSAEDDDDDCISVDQGDEEDSKVEAFLKEFGGKELPKRDSDNEDEDSESDAGNETESSDSGESDNDDDKDGGDDDNDTATESKPFKRKQSNDVSEGKTVFIRNISFKNTEEDLQELMQEYGETVYCLPCTDPITGHFKGTAFVKFKEKESADKLIKEASKEDGILLDGRKLLCDYALSREELSKRPEDSSAKKDKRNLRLLKCGLIAYGSKESEGVSQSDMAKRAQLETVKKQKLKNVNFFVSDKRLACHNLPKNMTDKDLYAMFKKAAGKEAVIKEARVMRDFKKTDAQGNPVSRGFGFVAFTEHEHALKVLMELNNNPKIFTPNKRPIVEFSVENKVALLSQERRRERMKLKSKKKVEESSKNESSQANEQFYSFKPTKQKHHKQIKQKKHKLAEDESTHEPVSPKKQKKNSRKERKRNQKKQTELRNRESISMLTKKYKDKLINKFS